ncbi:hypothetical protein [Henriciella sp.]|uniref:hypothetical protein n=1 Tax=Henriciella sp. TaxID=1968823 RepID=UPI002601F6E3|nr:hypothetical protein [Henriciella sp.]
MLRLFSLILLLAGLTFLGWGGYRYYMEEQVVGSGSQVAEDQPFQSSSPQASGPARRSGETAAFEAAPAESDTFGIASATSEMMARLRTVPIAHETPTDAKFNRAFEVTVAIDATGDETAADALPGEGNVVEGEAQILDKAQATLTGPAFDIDPVSPSIQRISPVTENIWRWRVTPLETGMHELRIELFALENDEALPIRTFTDRVEVRVSRLGQALAMADTFDPVFMILGGAGSLLAGLFGVFRFFRGR